MYYGLISIFLMSNERKRESVYTYLQVHSPDACKAKNPIQDSQVSDGNPGTTHHCRLPGSALVGSWSQEPKAGIKSKYSDVDVFVLTMKLRPSLLV